MRTVLAPALAALTLAAAPALADDQSQFCDGFRFGYKTAKGNNAALPPCPPRTNPPPGGTAYQEGVKAGMQAGQR